MHKVQKGGVTQGCALARYRRPQGAGSGFPFGAPVGEKHALSKGLDIFREDDQRLAAFS